MKFTFSFAVMVASLGGSRIMTERLMWMIGTAGIVRSMLRKGPDCDAIT
jgi:hypothetical protein